MYKLTFKYDNRGYGDLCVLRNEKAIDSFRCRTGSINGDGNLANAIRPGKWTAKEPLTDTNEVAMIVDGIGFKLRLWTPEGEWSHYLIHPDGNKPGSDGCIVSQSKHKELYQRLKELMIIMRELPVEVSKIKEAL